MSGLVEGQINLPQAKERTWSNLHFILLLFPQGRSLKEMRYSLKTQVFLSFLESLIMMTQPKEFHTFGQATFFFSFSSLLP